MASWGVAQAKAQFSAVLDKAESEGAQLVQRRKKRFIVLTEEELDARMAKTQIGRDEGSGKQLWDALRLAPEARFDDDFPRLNWSPRKVDL